LEISSVLPGPRLSTVTHHIPDLTGAARELRRALRPGAPVLIRNFFPGRTERVSLLRFFPEIQRVFDTYPSVEATSQAFAAAGFTRTALESVPQQTAPTLAIAAQRIRRDADTGLRSLTDEEFSAGMNRLHDAVAAEAADPQPVIDWLDLLVLR
jgi:hypothetical protein